MYPPVWGPDVWGTCHLMAHLYPENPSQLRQASFLQFIAGIMMNLPCQGCQMHATAYVKSNPPPVTSRSELKKWFVDFHNTVNLRTGKSAVTYEEADKILQDRYFTKTVWDQARTKQQTVRSEQQMIQALKAQLKKMRREKNIQEENHEQLFMALFITTLIAIVVISICFSVSAHKRK